MTKKEQIPSKAEKQETVSPHGGSAQTSSPDKLTKTGKKGDVELTDDELKNVAGGAVDAFMKY